MHGDEIDGLSKRFLFGFGLGVGRRAGSKKKDYARFCGGSAFQEVWCGFARRQVGAFGESVFSSLGASFLSDKGRKFIRCSQKAVLTLQSSVSPKLEGSEGSIDGLPALPEG